MLTCATSIKSFRFILIFLNNKIASTLLHNLCIKLLTSFNLHGKCSCVYCSYSGLLLILSTQEGMAATEFPTFPEFQEADDWTYTMRRSMQEIIPGLYLGPYSAAMKSKLESLTAHGITHIICVRQNIEAHCIRANFPDRFR